MIQSHDSHVKSNEEHNDHIEFLAGYDLKHHGLWFELEEGSGSVVGIVL